MAARINSGLFARWSRRTMRNSLLTYPFVRLAIAAVTLAATMPVVSAQEQGVEYTIVSTFEIADGRPSGVILARDGQFYGTTSGPGVDPATLVGQMGTVFAMDAAGTRRRLHTFQGNVIGRTFDGSPVANLLEV